MKTKQTFSNYSVGDFLVRVKNAAMAGNKTVEYEAQKQIVAVAAALKKYGFLSEVKNEKGKSIHNTEGSDIADEIRDYYNEKLDKLQNIFSNIDESKWILGLLSDSSHNRCKC